MTEQNATNFMENQRKRDEELRRRMFEAMMEAFYNRWAPLGSDGNIALSEASHFSAELHMLIRQVYTDAQAPLLEQMTKLISVMPMHPIAGR